MPAFSREIKYIVVGLSCCAPVLFARQALKLSEIENMWSVIIGQMYAHGSPLADVNGLIPAIYTA